MRLYWGKAGHSVHVQPKECGTSPLLPLLPREGFTLHSWVEHGPVWVLEHRLHVGVEVWTGYCGAKSSRDMCDPVAPKRLGRAGRKDQVCGDSKG